MPRVLKAKLHEFLRDYRRRVFELEHEASERQQREQRAHEFVDEVLDQKFHYHFHKKVNPDRAEIIQLIHNYCREALMPPVVSRLAERMMLAEQRHLVALDLVQRVLDHLAEDLEADAAATAKAGHKEHS